MVPLRDTVLIAKVEAAFDGQGDPTDFGTRTAMGIMLDDLAWWAELLQYGRTKGELLPAAFRLMEATAKAQQATGDRADSSSVDERTTTAVKRSHG